MGPYLIASRKRTSKSHRYITFWRPNRCGYAWSLPWAGRYDAAAIYVAGPQADAERICREFVLRGLCVTVEPVEFIYTGGQERGIRVGLINYPRFPTEPSAIFALAEELAQALIEGLHQHSASIVASDKTVWLSRREQNA